MKTHIQDWQRLIGAYADGDFGPKTLAASKELLPKPKLTAPRLSVSDHWLTGTGVELERLKPSWSRTIKPELIVIHYAVTHSLSATVAAQRARGYWAHLSIDGYSQRMRVVQQLAFNRRGAHAGKSSWNGRGGANGYSIGVEIANPGPLIKGSDGLLRTTYGKIWDAADAVETGRVPGYPSTWTHWAKYSPEEMLLLVAICSELRETYGISDIVGHSDISPGRKFDPGPAFDMAGLRRAVL